jgi:hypothetical protein
VPQQRRLIIFRAIFAIFIDIPFSLLMPFYAIIDIFFIYFDMPLLFQPPLRHAYAPLLSFH